MADSCYLLWAQNFVSSKKSCLTAMAVCFRGHSWVLSFPGNVPQLWCSDHNFQFFHLTLPTSLSGFQKIYSLKILVSCPCPVLSVYQLLSDFTLFCYLWVTRSLIYVFLGMPSVLISLSSTPLVPPNFLE